MFHAGLGGANGGQNEQPANAAWEGWPDNV